MVELHVFANSGNPDQTPRFAASDLGCTVCQLPVYGSPVLNGLKPSLGQPINGLISGVVLTLLLLNTTCPVLANSVHCRSRTRIYPALQTM